VSGRVGDTGFDVDLLPPEDTALAAVRLLKVGLQMNRKANSTLMTAVHTGDPQKRGSSVLLRRRVAISRNGFIY